MNMLTNTTPFGLLSEEEQELFENADSLEVYVDWRWEESAHDEYQKGCACHCAYRLRLEEDCWYYADGYCIDVEIKKYDGEWTFDEYKDKYHTFRPATKEEIKSVKPKKTTVDVAIKWKDGVYAMVDGWTEIGNHFEEINQYPIGFHCGDGWILSGYIYNKGEYHEFSPISFGDCGKKILKKATHARFVRAV